MKSRIIYFICLFAWGHCLLSQTNYIYNPGFENGTGGHTPACSYDYSGSGTDIEDHMSAWVNGATASGHTANSRPDWMDDGCSSSISALMYSGMRFMYLEDKVSAANSSDAIRTGLTTTLSSGNNYAFRISYIGVEPKSGGLNKNERIRVYLTKYSEHWNKTWGNVSISFDMYPPAYPPVTWVQHSVPLPGTLLDFAGIGNLHNIVIVAEQGEIYTDYVELSTICESPQLVQGRSFHFPEDPVKSGSYVRAGNSVGGSGAAGDVILYNGSNTTFKAEDYISLESGFVSLPGAVFNTVIQSCNNTVTYRTTDEYDLDSLILIDDRIDTIDCTDTIHIVGLDGDTAAYSSFYWDFGNNNTSNNNTVDINYPTAGSYTVTLIITDTLGVTDTLSKVYMVECDEGRAAGIKSSGQFPVIELAPNPTKGEFDLRGDLSLVKAVEITNLIGTRLYNSGSETSAHLDITGAADGIYFVKITLLDGRTQVKRLVIQ